MKKNLFIFFTLLFTKANAQWSMPTFINFYEAPYTNISNYSYSIIQTKDAGFAFFGESVFQAGVTTYKSHAVLYKTDNTGMLQWQKVFENPLGNTIGYSLKELEDSSLVLCGTSEYSGLFIAKTDKYGDTLWTRTLPLNIGTPKLQVSLDGGLVVAGTKSSLGVEVRLLKFNPLGYLVWDKHYDWFHYADLRCYDIQRLADSGYMLTGTTYEPTTIGSCIFFVRTDKYGDTVWTKLWQRTPPNSIRMRRVIQTADGGFIAAGGNVFEGIVLKMDSVGNDQWVKYIPAADGMDIYEDTTDGYYLFTASGYKFSMQKLNFTGDSILWSYNYGVFTPQYPETFSRTREGGFIMTGAGRDSSGKSKAMLVKVDSTYFPGLATQPEVQPGSSINLFPNPAQTTITIVHTLPSRLLHLRICDITGKVLLERSIDQPLNTIDISTLSDGIYVYHVADEHGTQIKSEKLEIRR